MRRLVLAGLLAALIVVATSSGTNAAKPRGPFLLVTLPSLGTVTWRCDASREPGVAPGLPGLALGFRVPFASATQSVRLHVGRRTISSRVVQPRQSVEFPYLRSRVQQLDIVQQTGAGTLRAFVTVDFVPHGPSTYCWPYHPPGVTVRLVPRR